MRGRYNLHATLRKQNLLSAVRRLHRSEPQRRLQCVVPRRFLSSAPAPAVPPLLESHRRNDDVEVDKHVHVSGGYDDGGVRRPRRLPQDGLNLHDFVAVPASSVGSGGDNNESASAGLVVTDRDDSADSAARPSFFIRTYGCQMNVNDSDILRTLLLSAGYREESGAEERADVVLTNTCAIREKAEQRVWTRLHQIKQRNVQKRRRQEQEKGNQVVGVVGCMAERLQTQLLDEGVADLALGPDRYRELPQLLDALLALKNSHSQSRSKGKNSSRNTSNESAVRDEMMSENVSVPASDGATSSTMMRSGLHLRSSPDDFSLSSSVSQADHAEERPTMHRTGAAATDAAARSERKNRMAETYDDILPFHEKSRVSSFVSIQRGCSNHCAFCIVPHVRGPERSRPLSSIVDEVQSLVDRGVKEITLLGQNVNSYHETSSSTTAAAADDYTLSNAGFRSRIRRPAGGYWFADLLDAVASVDREVRVRFTSPHPKDYPPALLGLMGDAANASPNICRHLHMPAQSGSTAVLARMKRGYSRDAYLELIESVREAIPDVFVDRHDRRLLRRNRPGPRGQR
jgi:tRNA A37 methylthiotransferase MiaB